MQPSAVPFKVCVTVFRLFVIIYCWRHTKMKKLILNQETLRNITEDELQQVVGFGPTNTCPPTRQATCLCQ